MAQPFSLFFTRSSLYRCYSVFVFRISDFVLRIYNRFHVTNPGIPDGYWLLATGYWLFRGRITP